MNKTIINNTKTNINPLGLGLGRLQDEVFLRQLRSPGGTVGLIPLVGGRIINLAAIFLLAKHVLFTPLALIVQDI